MNRCAAAGFKTNQGFKKVTHVIFDLDGVLLDTQKLYTLGVQNVVNNYGKVYTWSTKAHVMGLPGAEAAKKIVELLELPISPKEFYKLAKIQFAIIMKDTEILRSFIRMPLLTLQREVWKIYTPEIQGKVIGIVEPVLPNCSDRNEFAQHLILGATRVVKHLYKHNIPIAVATSSSQDSFNLKAAKHKDLFNLFSHIVCGGSDPEVKKGKPNPDIFLICASRFADKPQPEKCLVFEDAPNGVNAALGASMQVVMIPDASVPVELTKDAHIVVNSIEDAPLNLFGLPPLTS